MSELSMFDYINGITIGSIAAEFATSLEEDYTAPLIAMIVYACVTIILSFLSDKSIIARRFIVGAPLVLLNNGTLYKKNLKKAKIDINELLQQCRIEGYFDISQVQTAILESNGKISILPQAANRPVTPDDMKLQPKDDALVSNLVIDGHIMFKNLSHSGKDEKWLRHQLQGQGVSNESEVLLATCDIHNKVTVFKKTINEVPKDILD